jgi:hypothetical protein
MAYLIMSYKIIKCQFEYLQQIFFAFPGRFPAKEFSEATLSVRNSIQVRIYTCENAHVLSYSVIPDFENEFNTFPL